ncbi:hypothetical protein VIGAN_08304600 [Vigna angularis var. angularis]|uniref:Uncharacterized protein n=1 Tax=Vigna angularis var. angularis TaxID=157739 RepID=A0A0S3STI7_PHAAN|nr:hypothetical protein VIGAN_08304600 [Vigna angularis var. angularis]
MYIKERGKKTSDGKKQTVTSVRWVALARKGMFTEFRSNKPHSEFYRGRSKSSLSAHNQPSLAASTYTVKTERQIAGNSFLSGTEVKINSTTITCSYCKSTGHTESVYFRKHGFLGNNNTDSKNAKYVKKDKISTKRIGTASLQSGLYVIKTNTQTKGGLSTRICKSAVNNNVWHIRLAHPFR